MNSSKFKIVTAAAIAIYIIAMTALCWHKYTNMLYCDFDLAVHTQTLRNILHGSSDSSILGVPFLGNHMVLILYPIAPLYLLFPSPMLLLVVQTLALAAGAWGIFLLARRELDDRFAAAFAIAYLIYPPLLYLNLYEFHPVALASCFLIYAFYFYRTERPAAFWTAAILAMMCQENIPLIIAGFGAYALLQRRSWKWIVPQTVTGILLFLIITVLILPRLNDKIQFLLMYSQFGSTPGEILRSLITHPLATVQFMFSAAKLDFLNLLSAPLGYLNILNPLAIVPGLPVIMQRLLSARPTEASMVYHYQAELIPFVFCPAILAVKFITTRFQSALSSALVWTILIIFPSAAFIMTVTQPGFSHDTNLARRNTAAGQITRRRLADLPATSSVISTFEFLSPLSGHRDLFSLHHVYYGRYTLSTIPYPAPANLDFIVMNAFDPITFSQSGFYGPSNYTNLQNLIKSGNWRVEQNLEGQLIFCAAQEKQIPPLRPLTLPASACAGTMNPTVPGIVFLGLELLPAVNGNIRELRLYWKKTEPDTPDFDIVVTLAAGGRSIWRGVLAPGNRIWPPQSWPPDTVLCDTHCILAEDGASRPTTVTIEPVSPMSVR